MRQVRTIAFILSSLLVGACGARSSKHAAPSPSVYQASPMSVAGTPEALSGNDFRDYGRNPWVMTSKDRMSTFAADVDTASYTIARRTMRGTTATVAR